MKALINKFVLKGEVIAPPSKSVAHRLLICACLTKGNTIIRNIAYSNDVLATIDCLTSLGASIEKHDDYVKVNATKFLDAVQNELNCNESGSTLRFMIPLALLTDSEIKLYGSKRLLDRPMDVYETLSKENNFEFINNHEYIKVKGKLESKDYIVRGDISSQFISGLLFALCYLNKKASISVIEPFESKSYVKLTIESLNTFGFNVYMNSNVIYIDEGKIKDIDECVVEADESNSAVLDSFNLLGSNVLVLGKNKASKQGDKIYEEYFKKIEESCPTLDISNCPDLGPILIALGALKNGVHLVGTKRLKDKECDRGQAMKEELSKLNADIEILDDEIIVRKTTLIPTKEILNSHNDHRIVMALTLVLSTLGGTINQVEAINKSFPDFFTKIIKLGGEVKLYDD